MVTRSLNPLPSRTRIWFSSKSRSFTRSRTHSIKRIPVPYKSLAIRPIVPGLLTRPWDRIQFAESRFALGRGTREGVYPRRYSTDRATKPQGKTASARRVAALLACGFVARRVTERCGYAPLLAPRHKPKSPATNCVLSYGLVSKSSGRHGRNYRWPAARAYQLALCYHP